MTFENSQFYDFFAMARILVAVFEEPSTKVPLDDHLRNNGFLLTAKGWRLAPMFDVNPNPDVGASALDRGDFIADADYYRLTKAEAMRRYEEISRIIKIGLT